ncbi:MAG: efflux RND transporter periplasmic adaptor subunit [Porticoccaceae bacterium]
MNKNVRIALWGSLAIVVWFGTGLLKSSDSTDTEVEAVDNLTKVQVVHSKQQPFGPTLSLRAKTKANRAVDVLAQVSGKISATLIEEGRPVAAGQGICEVDAEDRPLRLSQAQAALENAEIAYRGALKLKAGGYQSELAISQAKTTLATAKTQVKRAQLDVANLHIKAPFNGIVENRPVEVGDFIAPGSHCARVVELNPLKIEALVTGAEIGGLSIGDDAMVLVAGKEYQGAKISYLAYQANPMTKGYRVEATMDNPDQTLRAGISAQLNIQLAPVQGHLVPSSTILLSDKGSTMIRVLDSNQIVESHKVTAVGESDNGIWVTGLPEEVVLVTVGQNYIIDGEHVEPAFPANSDKK